MPDDALLEVRRLGITFTQYGRGLRRRELHPVKELNLTLNQGEMVAVVGASGSGKSLLAHALLGIMPYNCCVTGEIFYRGEPLTGNRLKLLRGREIALVPQGVSYLDPLMKVGEQIRKGRKDQNSAERCTKLLARFGLGPETEKRYPFELSGGMARRILIAAALMDEPKLVIADEPTPGLELKTARRVMGHFREIAEDGASVLFITHDLELALETADRIMVFYEGRIIEEVRPGDFHSPDRLRHPYTRALHYAMPEHEFTSFSGDIESEGISAEGISAEGVSAEGISAEELSAEKISMDEKPVVEEDNHDEGWRNET